MDFLEISVWFVNKAPVSSVAVVTFMYSQSAPPLRLFVPEIKLRASVGQEDELCLQPQPSLSFFFFI